LSGLGYAWQIPVWRREGWLVMLVFLSLPSADMAVGRVAQGGHHIAEATIRRRFDVGRRNFDYLYKRLVDAWMLHDNSEPKPFLIDGKQAK
jgi:predicted ABC-type ATPase